jgi:hypothetical protein
MVNAAQPVGLPSGRPPGLGYRARGFTVLDLIGHTDASCRVIFPTQPPIARSLSVQMMPGLTGAPTFSPWAVAVLSGAPPFFRRR